MATSISALPEGLSAVTAAVDIQLAYGSQGPHNASPSKARYGTATQRLRALSAKSLAKLLGNALGKVVGDAQVLAEKADLSLNAAI